MSFAKAKNCFIENRNAVGQPLSDPQTYNLNQGLQILTGEIEDGFRKIDAELRKIHTKLDSLSSAVRRQ